VSPSTQKTAASSGWIPDPTPQYRHCSTTTTTRTSPLRAQAEPPTNSKTANVETRLRRWSAQSPTRGYAKGALPRSGRHRHWPRGHGDRRTVEPIEGRTRTEISNALSPPSRAKGELDNSARISPPLNADVRRPANTRPSHKRKNPAKSGVICAQRQNRTADTRIFNPDQGGQVTKRRA
jgi:hypothetical protein